MPRWLIALGVVLVFLVGLGVSTSLGGLNDEQLAERLLWWNAVACTPKIVDRPEEDVLRVVCADGKHEFVVQPMCDESFACAWGIDVACWDHEPNP